jgi:hypothetical protein
MEVDPVGVAFESLSEWQIVPPQPGGLGPPRRDYCKSSTTTRKLTSVELTSTLVQVLGIPKTDNLRAILQAFVEKSQQCHPDRPESNPSDLRLFQEIGDAYYTLSNNQRREEYTDSDRKIQFVLADLGSTPEEGQRLYLQQFLIAMDANTKNRNHFWTIVGTVGGSLGGLVIGGPLGAGVGAVVGSQCGVVQDTTGKNIVELYQSYTPKQKWAMITKMYKKFKIVSAVAV